MSEQEWAELVEEQDPIQEEDSVEVVETADTAPEPADADLGAMDVEFHQVDLNTATVEELRQLPGIGEALAARIVDYRAEAGPFGEPAAITAVAGVSESMYARLADRLSVGGVEPPLAPVPEAALPETEVSEEAPELEVEPEMEAAVGMVDLEPEPADVEIEGP